MVTRSAGRPSQEREVSLVERGTLLEEEGRGERGLGQADGGAGAGGVRFAQSFVFQSESSMSEP